MTLELYRIDDRLIHGQVVVGWGQPLDIDFIVLVDDTVATSDWEQELYRMGVPPEMDVYFHTARDAVAAIPAYRTDARRGLQLKVQVGHEGSAAVPAQREPSAKRHLLPRIDLDIFLRGGRQD